MALNLCGYFCIVTSEKITAEEALIKYKGRDISEKLFRADKGYIDSKSMRVYSSEAVSAKTFVEFIALIVRNCIYNLLKEVVIRMESEQKYMTVPAAIRELEKIEMVRRNSGLYRLDHAITKIKNELSKLQMKQDNLNSRLKALLDQKRNYELNLYLKYKDFDSGTISVCRGDLNNKENKERTHKLKTDLIKLGYSVTAIKGVYKENYGKENERKVHEDSFIVFDHNNTGDLRDNLLKLGAKYDQESVTYANVTTGKYYLIGTNETGYPGKNVEVVLGSPMFGENGEFFSSIRVTFRF